MLLSSLKLLTEELKGDKSEQWCQRKRFLWVFVCANGDAILICHVFCALTCAHIARAFVRSNWRSTCRYVKNCDRVCRLHERKGLKEGLYIAADYTRGMEASVVFSKALTTFSYAVIWRRGIWKRIIQK